MPAQPKEILEKLLTLLGFEATVAERDDDGHILLDIQTDDPGRLIGRQGQTLSELQYLTNRIIFRDNQQAPKVTLDVGGYRSQAREALVRKAQDAAEKVRRWGDIIEMEPLNAFDRRIVHTALKDDPDIETQSVEVEGTDHKVVLLRPRRNQVN